MSHENNKAYRDAAARIFPMVKVPAHAPVQPCEGGAFVELTGWVPDTALTPAPPAVEHDDDETVDYVELVDHLRVEFTETAMRWYDEGVSAGSSSDVTHGLKSLYDEMSSVERDYFLRWFNLGWLHGKTKRDMEQTRAKIKSLIGTLETVALG